MGSEGALESGSREAGPKRTSRAGRFPCSTITLWEGRPGSGWEVESGISSTVKAEVPDSGSRGSGESSGWGVESEVHGTERIVSSWGAGF